MPASVRTHRQEDPPVDPRLMIPCHGHHPWHGMYGTGSRGVRGPPGAHPPARQQGPDSRAGPQRCVEC